MAVEFSPGTRVVFQMSKISTEPCRRAHDVHPSASGETYSYVVDKYWTVSEVLPTGELQLVTRRGKRHSVRPDDPRLRPARWWELWLYSDRFPDPAKLESLPQGRCEKSRAAS